MSVTIATEFMPIPIPRTPARRARTLPLSVLSGGIGRGDGILAGTSPTGLTTVAGVPTQALVRILARSPFPEVDGVIIGEVLSGVDGTWEMPGVNPNMQFDVVARKATYNDVIQSSVTPYAPPRMLSYEVLAVFGEALTFPLQFANGVGPYTTSITSGALPTGLSLVANQITGTTTGAAGVYSVVIEVDDSRGDNPTSSTFKVFVDVLFFYVGIDNLSPYYSGGTITAQMAPRGGVPPYTYAVTAGALAAGVSLNATTGAITGTPTAAGTATITTTDSTAATYDTPLVVVFGIPHLYWRINITAGVTYSSLTEVEMSATAAGANQCTGGTASASASYDANYLPANAFDGNRVDELNSTWAPSSASPTVAWIQYQFVTPVVVTEIRLQPRFTYNQYPTAFTIQHSDDGITWTNDASYSGLTTGWAIGTLRTFAV